MTIFGLTITRRRPSTREVAVEAHTATSNLANAAEATAAYTDSLERRIAVLEAKLDLSAEHFKNVGVAFESLIETGKEHREAIGAITKTLFPVAVLMTKKGGSYDA